MSERAEWEYADTMDDDNDGSPIDPHRHHVRRAWTIRRWIAEQSRLAPIEAPAAPPPVTVANDWRGAPSAAEVAAHHRAHALNDVSRWVLRTTPDASAVVAEVRGGVLAWLPSEVTLWRPSDAHLTPVTWPEVTP